MIPPRIRWTPWPRARRRSDPLAVIIHDDSCAWLIVDLSGRSESETSEEDLQAMQEELQRAAAEAEQQQSNEPEEAMSEAQAEAMRRAQEQTQAMEQWLRRIENDPGGLLRRKFRYQYQRQGRDQDGNSVWPDDDVEPW